MASSEWDDVKEREVYAHRPMPVTQCAWCKSVDINGAWIKTAHTFFATHGICPLCLGKLSGSDLDWSGDGGESEEASPPPQEAAASETHEKRRHPRLDLRLPLKIRNLNAAGPSEIEETHTVNISPGGALVLTAQPLEPGMRLEVLLPEAGPQSGDHHRHAYRCLGRVVHAGERPASAEGRSVGIAFSDRFECLEHTAA